MATCKTGAALGGDGPHVSANHRVPFGGASWAQEAFQMGPWGLSRAKVWGAALFVPGQRAHFAS